MHNNGNFKELARDQDQVVVAKTKHAALLFSFFFKSKGFHIHHWPFFLSKNGVFWKILQKNVEKELRCSDTYRLGPTKSSLSKPNVTEPILKIGHKTSSRKMLVLISGQVPLVITSSL